MAAICGEGKIFLKLQRVHFLDTPWVENFDEIALSRTVKEIEANLCFAIVYGCIWAHSWTLLHTLKICILSNGFVCYLFSHWLKWTDH